MCYSGGMIQTLHVPVSVTLKFDHKARALAITKVIYDGTEYRIRRIGLHFTRREGRSLIHVFAVASDSMFLKLELDTETLQWHLKELHDHDVH